MNNKNVSIVIPTFNRADYLVECIDSCLAQTISCEIIVCDHGSTDNTPEVVKKYGDKIKYVRRELDSGVHFCWLDGILHTTNDLIHINYDDDWIKPTFIEECVKLFTDEVGCVFSEILMYFDNEKKYSTEQFRIQPQTGIYPVKSLVKFSMWTLVSPGAAIFRKKILIDNLLVGQIPFSKHEYHGVGPDILFSLMSTIDYPLYGFVKEPLAIFRAHDKSITIDSQKDKVKQEKINNAYNEARLFYCLHKVIKKFYVVLIAKRYFKIKFNKK